jgi:hypothetical protein
VSDTGIVNGNGAAPPAEPAQPERIEVTTLVQIGVDPEGNVVVAPVGVDAKTAIILMEKAVAQMVEAIRFRPPSKIVAPPKGLSVVGGR